MSESSGSWLHDTASVLIESLNMNKNKSDRSVADFLKKRLWWWRRWWCGWWCGWWLILILSSSTFCDLYWTWCDHALTLWSWGRQWWLLLNASVHLLHCIKPCSRSHHISRRCGCMHEHAESFWQHRSVQQDRQDWPRSLWHGMYQQSINSLQLGQRQWKGNNDDDLLEHISLSNILIILL